MKKLFAIILCLALLLVGCSGPQGGDSAGSVITDEVKAKLDAVLQQYNYQGIVSLTHNGSVVYQWVQGTNDLGEPLTMDSHMYICSMSKQFCATAILLLRDQGKLSVEDTLDQYFPEYTIGKDITLKNLLSMRSGITRDVTPMFTHPERYEENTREENIAAFKEWVFRQSLNFDPDTKFEYSNVNYVLLSLVVEMVSGQNYEDFIRQNIFEPLGMTDSGFHIEVPDHPEWGLTYDNIQATGQVHILAQGSGGIVTTAADMDKWMTGLRSGKVLSQESYREMTTDHSAGEATSYGYGLMGSVRDGWGHTGGNGGYTSRTYFNEEYGYNLFMATGNTPPSNLDYTNRTSVEFLKTLFEAVDAAASD